MGALHVQIGFRRVKGLIAPLEREIVWPDKRPIEVSKEDLPDRLTVIAVAGEGGG